jgi:hypothetical protein
VEQVTHSGLSGFVGFIESALKSDRLGISDGITLAFFLCVFSPFKRGRVCGDKSTHGGFFCIPREATESALKSDRLGILDGILA